MKKFKIIRNVLITLIVLIALVYILTLRDSNIQKSKSYKLFKAFITENYNQVSMRISYENQDVKLLSVYETNNKEEYELKYFKVDYSDNSLSEENNGATVTRTTSNNKQVFTVFPTLKKYKIIYDNNIESNNNFDEWIDEILYELEDCDYYTKGFEIKKGKILYFEEFKDVGLKLYYENNDLIYLKSIQIDQSLNNINNVIYNIELSSNDNFKELGEIPSDYTEIK